MSTLNSKSISSSSDDELFTLLSKELEYRIPAARGSLEFLVQIRRLPVGLRAMAATYELDVSLTMDDLGWHFGPTRWSSGFALLLNEFSNRKPNLTFSFTFKCGNSE